MCSYDVKGVFMKKFLQKMSLNVEDTIGASLKEKGMAFINAHPEVFCLALLAISCIVFLFCGLGSYPLMDVDETRYAVIARDLIGSFDWNSLMLNNVPFLEKPPLYFWLVGASIKLLGGFSEFAVRFPIALLATFIVFFTYFVGKKVISRKFGMISSMVLLSSIFFLILSHVAILDMVLTVFMTSAIYCGFLTHFCEQKYKKYFWWYFYLFIGFGFLAKGILALVIPFTIVFLYNLATKTAKDMFKPLYMVPGSIILLVMVLPWHIIMYQSYGYEFIKQYFIMHHFARFLNSETIGRDRPLLYFIPVFLLGFMPWTIIFIASLADGVKKLVAKYKAAEGKVMTKLLGLLDVQTNEQKMLLFASIYFAVVFIVFSVSSTKLPTYILPLFPAASFLTGYYWWVGDEKGEHQKSIYNSTLIFSSLFILAAIVASVSFYFLPYNIQYKLESFNQQTIIGIYMLCILLILRLNTKRALSIFSGYMFFMFFIITFAATQIFNFVYATGENEIVNYSLLSRYDGNKSQLVTFDFAVKPSALVGYDDYVFFLTDPDFKELDRILEYRGGPTFVIVKNKNMMLDDKYAEKITSRLEHLETGERYSLYVKDIHDEFNNRNEFCFGGGMDAMTIEPTCDPAMMEGPNPMMEDRPKTEKRHKGKKHKMSKHKSPKVATENKDMPEAGAF